MSAHRLPRAATAYLAVGLILTAAYFVLPLGQGLALHLVYDIVGVSSVIAIIIGIHWHKPASPLPWYLFAAGLLLFVAGDGARAFYESVIGVEAPFPSVADALYLAAYPVLALALLRLSRSRNAQRDRAAVIDSLIVATSFGAFLWVIVMHPYIADEFLTWPERIVSIAYPLWDIVLIAVAARLAFGSGVRTPSFYWLGAGLLALLAADSALMVTTLNGTYVSGSWVDLGFLLSYVFWGVSALLPSMSRLSEGSEVTDEAIVNRGRIVVLLAGAWLVTPAVRIVQRVRGDSQDIEVYVTVGATVLLFGLVLARMAGLVNVLSEALRRQREAEAGRRGSEERFRSLVQNSFDIVAVVDGDGRIVYASPAVQPVLGHSPAELEGQHFSRLVHVEDESRLAACVSGIVESGQVDRTTRVEFRWRHKQGHFSDVEAWVGNSLDDPYVGGIVFNIRDISERKALESQLIHQAFHDPLTELPNRALFTDRVEQALARREGPVSVLFLDVDDFKTINDSMGHSVGDELLLAIARRLVECLRSGDTAARLGGDEFAVLVDNAQDATAVARRITAALRRPFLVEGREMSISASIGICKSVLATDGVDELLRNADVAMYTAKGRGKGRHATFSTPMLHSAVRRLDIASELGRAIEEREFTVHYQPILEVRTGRMVALEALVRWAHPERGLLAPGDFIGVAEETGQIVPMGLYVLEEACKQALAWRARFDDTLTVNVNISAAQLESPDLHDEVVAILERTGLPAEALTLEVTESILLRDTEAVLERLSRFHELGVKIAIDDFGTGFSSLSYLRSFPCDALKVAKEFVDSLGVDPEATALVQGIIHLAHSLDLLVVAEGAEHERQLVALRELGCDLIQGYTTGRPQGGERITRLIEGGDQHGDERFLDPDDPAAAETERFAAEAQVAAERERAADDDVGEAAAAEAERLAAEAEAAAERDDD